MVEYMAESYVIGVDFGSDSVRALVVNTETGENIGQGVAYYSRWKAGLYQHPELSIDALQHNLHVMCEKPAGVYTKQVREMNEVAKKTNRVFAMMFNQRTNCVYRKSNRWCR